MHTVDVYAMPRSGTNLFANYLALHVNVHVVNTGGGRFLFRRPMDFKSSMSENILIRKAEMIDFIIKDEVHIEFVGRRRHWISQFLYKFYSQKHAKLVLIRNPFSVMRSMHHYYLKNLTHPHWNMESHTNQIHFLNTYEKYFVKSNQHGFRAVYLDLFAGDQSYRQKLIKDLGIGNISKQNYQCNKGHIFSSDVMKCGCGDIVGQGGFIFNANFDLQRLNYRFSEIVSKNAFVNATTLINQSRLMNKLKIKDGEPLKLDAELGN